MEVMVFKGKLLTMSNINLEVILILDMKILFQVKGDCQTMENQLFLMLHGVIQKILNRVPIQIFQHL